MHSHLPSKTNIEQEAIDSEAYRFLWRELNLICFFSILKLEGDLTFLPGYLFIIKVLFVLSELCLCQLFYIRPHLQATDSIVFQCTYSSLMSVCYLYFSSLSSHISFDGTHSNSFEIICSLLFLLHYTFKHVQTLRFLMYTFFLLFMSSSYTALVLF